MSPGPRNAMMSGTRSGVCARDAGRGPGRNEDRGRRNAPLVTAGLPAAADRHQRLHAAPGHHPRRRLRALPARGLPLDRLPREPEWPAAAVHAHRAERLGVRRRGRRAVLVQRAARARLQPDAAALQLRQAAALQRHDRHQQRPAAGQESQADVGQVHQGRGVPVLLRRPLRHDRHGARRAPQPAGAVSAGRPRPREASGRGTAADGQGPRRQRATGQHGGRGPRGRRPRQPPATSFPSS